MAFPYHHVRREDGGESLVVILPDGPPVVLNDDHPQFDAVLTEVSAAYQDEGAISADEIRELADLSVAVAEKFQSLSERVSVANGRVYFDGDEVHNALTRQIVRVLDAKGNFAPLVRFFEKLAANPQSHSREQLYEWLDRRDFAISLSGDVIAYKGVAKDGEGNLVSVNAGPAVVDGVAVNGQVPNAVGSTVELARSSVAFDPSVGCASGLHVGTFEYARGWARGALLKVAVNPRDVVSVPTDNDAAKVRVCRYRVLEVIDAPETAPVAYDQDDEECEFCGDDPDLCEAFGCSR